MYTRVEIVGQPNGNNVLDRAISGHFDTSKNSFGSIVLTFKTKKKALAALKEAHRKLVLEEPDFAEKIVLSEKKDTLWYDASKAYIPFNF